MTLKFYTSVAKELKLKVRKFCGLTRTFGEGTGEKLVAPPPSWIELTTSFLTTSLSLVKSTGTGTNSSTSNLTTLLFKLLKLLSTFLNFLMSNLSTLGLKLAKSVFFAKSDLSTPVGFF